MRQCRGEGDFIMSWRIRDHCVIARNPRHIFPFCSFELIPIFDGSFMDLTRLMRPVL
jgi:hypothetical protein